MFALIGSAAWGFLKPYAVKLFGVLAIVILVLGILLKAKNAGRALERAEQMERDLKAAKARAKVDVEVKSMDDEEIDDYLRPPEKRKHRTYRSLLPLALILVAFTLSACGFLRGEDRAIDPCLGFRPVYLSDDAITALRPYRAERETIAANNKFWEGQCSDMAKREEPPPKVQIAATD